MRRLLSRLRCRRGTATIEFALMSLFLFSVVMVALDFGLYMQQRLKLSAAVEAGAMLAFKTRSVLDVPTVKSYIETYAGTKATPTATITCNGTANVTDCVSGRCSCITAAGAFTAVGTCGSPRAACATGSNEGTYMKIVASMTYTPMVLPNRYLGGSTVSASTVVRLQ